MKTDLELLSEQTVKNGGDWFLLEESEVCNLYKVQGKWCDGRNYFNTQPVYQIFDSKGKRILVTESYNDAYRFYHKRMSEWEGKV